MRHIATAAQAADLVLIDGVKVVEAPDRWALVIPYPDEPLCQVWAEDRSAAEAEARADRFARLVSEISEGGEHAG